jgi:hypothetical protein
MNRTLLTWSVTMLVNTCMAQCDQTFTATPTWEVDCATGIYRMQVTVLAEIGGCLTADHPYFLTSTLGYSANGTLSSDWVSVYIDQAMQIWNYPVSLPCTEYTFTIPPEPCSGSTVCFQSPAVFGPPTPITAGDCGVNVRLRAALDGALPTGTLMTDGLRAANLIPTLQPYTALGYGFVGSPTNVTIAPSLLAVTGGDGIVDWVIVELRNAVTPTNIVYSKPALLQRDGDVIDTDGNAYINCPVAAGSYRVAIRHRNHLGVMTNAPRNLNTDPYSPQALVDFSISSLGTFGTNARVQKGTVWCLWAGDATGNGQLKYTGTGNDRDPILTAVGSTTPNSTLSNQYSRLDANLDGVIKYTGSGNDRDFILTNVGSTTPNNTRTQQLP